MNSDSENTPIIHLGDVKSIKSAKRIDEVEVFFGKIYEKKPAFFVNVPGRVNLIGEHVDYCGYPVLPMAIEQSILLAVKPTDNGILTLANINPKYERFSCDMDKIVIPQTAKNTGPNWYNYFLCGVKGVIEQLSGDVFGTGMDIIVSGNVPAASGLSSSSALVSAAVLATSHCYQFSLSKKQLSSIAAECEKYIGTQGGGMDQAIAFLAREGCAQFIEWNPLRATSVTLPSNAYFVIANSLSKANKAATADFNQRVVECRIACKILAKKLNLPWREINRLSALQDKLEYNLEEVIEYTRKLLPKNYYSREDILQELNISSEELNDEILTVNTKHVEEFKLRQRALHVFEESLRVLQFRIAAESDGCIKTLSTLMRASHKSLDEQYECSHPNLNEMVKISDGLGIGSRLTGAGWGGCIVALCDSLDLCNEYMAELKEKYYAKLEGIDQEQLNEAIFVTAPYNGAEIYIH